MSVHTEGLGCNWTDFCEIPYWGICAKTCWLNWLGIRHKQLDTLYEYVLNSWYLAKHCFCGKGLQRKPVEHSEHILYQIYFTENRTLYDIITKKKLRRGKRNRRPSKQCNIIWLRIACWEIKQKNTKLLCLVGKEILHNEVTDSPYEMFSCIVLTRVGHVETLLTFCEFLCRVWKRTCEVCVHYMQQYFFSE